MELKDCESESVGHIACWESSSIRTDMLTAALRVVLPS